jgi:hypothetical protein
MIESNPALGDSPMTAILYRRLMYPYTQAIAMIVHEWYEHARSKMEEGLLDTDAACVSLYTTVLPTCMKALEQTGSTGGDDDSLQELIACCLEAERARPAWDSLPAAKRNELLVQAGIEQGPDNLSPAANLTLWHMRTAQTVPGWYANAQSRSGT